MKANLLPLAKEGINYFLISLSLFSLCLVFDFDFLAFIAFFATLFVSFSFRNPERELAIFENGSLLSPADGIVQSITELDNDEYAYKIEIQSSCTDVGVLRIPTHAKVSSVIKSNGSRLSSDSKLYSSLNENAVIVFTTQEENIFKVVHRLQRSFAPLFIELTQEQNVVQTTRYGMMLNGTTTIYLPQNFRLNIKVGSQLKASESLMGYFS